MNTKTIAMSAALAAALAAPLAFAQGDGVARLKDVKGNVLVSQQTGLAAGSEAARLAEHTRVITTAGAEAIVMARGAIGRNEGTQINVGRLARASNGVKSNRLSRS